MEGLVLDTHHTYFTQPFPFCPLLPLSNELIQDTTYVVRGYTSFLFRGAVVPSCHVDAAVASEESHNFQPWIVDRDAYYTFSDHNRKQNLTTFKQHVSENQRNVECDLFSQRT